MTPTTKTTLTIRTEPVTQPESYVQPAELCDMQRRSMAYDAFAMLQARGF